MECRSTIELKRTKDGIIPVVPCGQCLNCRLNRRDKWVTRCLLESLSATSGQFWTLTFSDEHLPKLEEQGPKLLVRKFLHALRQKERRAANPHKIRCFGALEYGELTHRPHLHLLIWNLFSSLQPTTTYKENLPLPKLHIGAWPHGHVNAQPLTPKSARYVCKYVTKFELEDTTPTVFHCQRPPLGLAGLYRHLDDWRKSPRAKWTHPGTILIDGKHWALDQTMRRHFMLISREMGIASHLKNFQTKALARQTLREERENRTWHQIESSLRREQTRDRQFDATLAKRELRSFYVWQRAAALSAVEQSHTHQSANGIALDT